MSAAVFSTQTEAELISLVEERRIIWDIRDQHYHRRELKEAAYAEICEALGGQYTVAQVRSRFANLRTQFMRERRKIKARSGASPDDIYEPRWAHYKRLLFLSSSCTSQPSMSTLDTQEEEEDIERQCDIWNSEALVPEASHEVEDSPPMCAESSAVTASRPAQKRKAYDEEKEQRKVLLTSAVETLQRSQQRLAAADECDAFGSMIAHAVRQIPAGPERQLAMLNAHQAIVKVSLSKHTTAVEYLDVIDMQD